MPRTTDTQWRHKSKISEKSGWCGRQNMLRPYLKIWEREWIFDRAVKAISSLGFHSPVVYAIHYDFFARNEWINIYVKSLLIMYAVAENFSNKLSLVSNLEAVGSLAVLHDTYLQRIFLLISAVTMIDSLFRIQYLNQVFKIVAFRTG